MSISKLPYLYYPLGYRLIPLFTERLRLTNHITAQATQSHYQPAVYSVVFPLAPHTLAYKILWHVRQVPNQPVSRPRRFQIFPSLLKNDFAASRVQIIIWPISIVMCIMPGQTWRDNGHKALCPLSQHPRGISRLHLRVAALQQQHRRQRARLMPERIVTGRISARESASRRHDSTSAV